MIRTESIGPFFLYGLTATLHLSLVFGFFKCQPLRVLLKLGCISNFNMLFLVSEGVIIGLVEENQFMLIRRRLLSDRSKVIFSRRKREGTMEYSNEV